MQRSARALVTAVAACLAVAFAAQSCGTLSSSDCAERATCFDAGRGGSGSSGGTDDSGGTGAEASDDGTAADDGTADDGASGNEESADVTGADVVGDVTIDGPTAADVASERDATPDASSDAMMRDVVTEKPPGDVCVATENCTNGIDDNCDGKTDCADPMCSAYACTAVAPTGWMGPALLWTGTFGSAAPSCPAGYTMAIDAFAGPTGAADTCSCTCSASGQVCSTTQNIFSDQACATACSSAGASNATCAPSSGNCGQNGSLKATAPALSGGTCMPQVTTTKGPAASWTTAARVCSWGGPVDNPGGCAAAGNQCVLAPPAGFATKLCVYQSGAGTCPAAYPNSNVFFATASDTRRCTGCTCSGPAGGSCSGSINVYAGATCGTPGATYSNWDSCQTYSGLGPTPALVQGDFTVTPGTCTPTAQPTPTGSVTGTGPTTVCCK